MGAGRAAEEGPAAAAPSSALDQCGMGDVAMLASAATGAAFRGANDSVNAAAVAGADKRCGEDMAEEEGASSSSDGRPKVPKTIANGRFQVRRKKLGSGSYSDVYMAVDSAKGDEVAVKFEWKHAEKTGKVLAEAKLCNTFAENRCAVPFVRWFGTEGEYNIMVMDILGASLEDMLEKCNGSLSLRTVLMLGEQMVTLLEYVHSCGIIHRDIKPNNFLIGREGSEDKVYIVDFGLAKRYIDADTGKHMPCNNKKGLTGTVRYTSLNVHRGLEPARRDDLGSVGYVLMYFALGRLPWQGISAKSKKTKQRRIGRRKEKTTHKELCQGFPEELIKYLDYCEELAFDARPDYDYLRSLLRKALNEECVSAGVTQPTLDWLLPEDERPLPAPQARRKRPRSDPAFPPLLTEAVPLAVEAKPVEEAVPEDDADEGSLSKRRKLKEVVMPPAEASPRARKHGWTPIVGEDLACSKTVGPEFHEAAANAGPASWAAGDAERQGYDVNGEKTSDDYESYDYETEEEDEEDYYEEEEEEEERTDSQEEDVDEESILDAPYYKRNADL